MTRLFSRHALPLVAAFVVAGCNQFTVRSTYDHAADFRGLRSYAWLPLAEAAPADQRVLDRYLDRRLRLAVDRELGAKGYEPAETGQRPDFLLNYRLAKEPASSMQAESNPYWGGAAWLAWPGAQAMYSDSYDEGTLYLAVIEPGSKHMIWIGLAQARLVPTMSLERKSKRVDAAVEQILARFPPK